MPDPAHEAHTAQGDQSAEETIALLQATLESASDGVLVVDRERRIVRFNQQFADLFHLPDAMMARLDTDEILSAVAMQLEDSDAVLLKSPEVWTTPPPRFLSRMRLKDGRVIERSAALHRAGGRAVSLIVRLRDVTQAVRTEEALELHRRFLERAQEVAHVGSWVLDLDGSNRLAWSAETHRIYGVSIGEFAITSQMFYDFVHPDDRDEVRTRESAAIRGEAPYDIEHRIVKRSGEVRWVHEKADIVRDAEEHAIRMIGTVQDITERRELEEQLRHAQRLDAIGRLAGGIAHDLNNALTAIAGYTELALNTLPETNPAYADVQEVRRAAERAASVTRQLLAFSRRQLLQPRLFDLNMVVSNLARLLERLLGEDIHLETMLASQLPPIHADPGHIEQAIINLAVNARDAMPDGGRISLVTSVERVDAPRAGARVAIPHGTYVVLRVTDTGHGMSRETQTHIFEPFFTTKPTGKGTGLGLAMVWGTVKQSGGFIFVDSAPQKGSTFQLLFPAADRDRPIAAGEADAGEPSAATVLVVEDEDAVRGFVTAALKREGYRVLQATSGEDAREQAAKAGRIDLLLTDATMPGMGGIELAQTLSAERPGLRVIVMSGYTEENLPLGGLAPQTTVLKKPFTPSELRRRIREALDTPPVRSR